jgi:hypothetical protein
MQQSSFRNGKIVLGIIACLLLAGMPAAMAADGINATSSTGGTIIVMSFPQGAAVTLNGEYRGIAPLTLQNLTPGNYEVAVTKAGYNNDTVPVLLYDGSTREIGFTLEPLTKTTAPTGSGSIAVDSNPGGAVVMIDGNTVGITRKDGYAFNVNNVPAGSHIVTVELTGYPAYTSSVTVIRNQVVKVDADFAIQTPTVPGTPVATTDRPKPVPLTPLTAIAAAGFAGIAMVFRRS